MRGTGQDTADSGREASSSERGEPSGMDRRSLLKTSAFALAALGAGPLLAGCGDDGGSSAGKALSSSGGTVKLDPNKTVRVWIQNYGDPAQQSAALAKIESACKSDIGVTVKFEGQDWATAEQKWDLAMSNGDLPDVGDMFYLPSRIVQGQGKWGPVDLTDRVDSGAFGDWDRIVESSRDESTIDGRIYGIPWRIDIRAWNHRSDIFDSVPKTLDDLETMGLAALQKDGVLAACTHFAQPVDALHQGAVAYGTTYLTPDYSASNLKDPTWVEVCEWMRDMSAKKVFLAQSELDTKFNQNGSFYSGVTGAVYGANALLNEANGVAPQVVPKLVSGLQPTGPVGKSVGLASCAQWSIFENSSAIEESAAFLAWLCKDSDQSYALNQATSTLSADTDVQKLDTDPYYQPFYEQAKSVDLIDMPIVAWNEMRVFPGGPLNVMANRVWGGNDDIQTILDDGHKEITDILAKYN
jgi:multiple sugar transport system substrate-binding protein